jgi:hypothetical protein
MWLLDFASVVDLAFYRPAEEKILVADSTRTRK